MLLLAIIALGVPLAINLRGRVNAEVRTQAQSQADLVAATAADMLGPVDRGELTTLARTAATSVRGRILIVGVHGQVLVDSAGPSQIGSSYESRPEIQSALAGHPIQVQRHSNTLRQEILATAVPIIRGGRPIGAVRVTQSIVAVNGAVQRVELGLGLLALVVLVVGLCAGVVVAAQVSRPINRLAQVARRVAGGDLSARAELEGSREQRLLASSFNDMTHRLSRLLSAQRDFVADASHQLRTPLTGLRLRLEEARAMSRSPAASEIDAGIAELDRLSHTIDELLVLSGEGESQVTVTRIDLDALASSALQRWRPRAAAAGIDLKPESEGSSGSAHGAPADFERALDALIENAVAYSPSGRAVTIVTAPGRIEVRDRGPGIDESERQLVFERFHRGRAGRAGRTGSGLGLAIARDLTRKWGGEVTLAPRTGGGIAATLSVCAEASNGSGEIVLPGVNSSLASV